MMPYMEIIDNVRKIFKGDLSILLQLIQLNSKESFSTYFVYKQFKINGNVCNIISCL